MHCSTTNFREACIQYRRECAGWRRGHAWLDCLIIWNWHRKKASLHCSAWLHVNLLFFIHSYEIRTKCNTSKISFIYLSCFVVVRLSIWEHSSRMIDIWALWFAVPHTRRRRQWHGITIEYDKILFMRSLCAAQRRPHDFHCIHYVCQFEEKVQFRSDENA